MTEPAARPLRAERDHRESADRALDCVRINDVRARQADDLAVALLAEGWTPPEPPPLTEEPTDLAARVVDKDGDLWAYDPKVGKWASVSTAARSWDVLAADYAPLRLWEGQ